MRILSGIAAVLAAALLTVSLSGCSGEGRVSMGDQTPTTRPTVRPTETVRPTSAPTDDLMEDIKDMFPSTNIGDRDDGRIEG